MGISVTQGDATGLNQKLFQLEYLNSRHSAATALSFVQQEAQYYDQIVDALARNHSLPEIEHLWPELSKRLVRTTHPTTNLSAKRQYLQSIREKYFFQLQQGNLSVEAASDARKTIHLINAKLKALPSYNALSAARPALVPMDEFRQQIPLFRNSANSDARAMTQMRQAFLRRFPNISAESPLLKHIVLNERMWACVDNDRGPVTAQDALDMAYEKNRQAYIVNARKLQALKQEIQDPELLQELEGLRLRLVATANSKGHSYLHHALNGKTIAPFASADEYVQALEQLQARFEIGGAQHNLYESLMEPIDLAKRTGFHLSVAEGRHNGKDIDAIAKAIAKYKGIVLEGLSETDQAITLSRMFEDVAHNPAAIDFDHLIFESEDAKKHAKKVWDIFGAYAKANIEIDPFSIRNAIIAECAPDRPYLLQTMRFLSARHGMPEFKRGQFVAASLLESPETANTLVARISSSNTGIFIQRYFNAAHERIKNGHAIVRQFFAGSDMLREAGIAHGTFSNFSAVRTLRSMYDHIVIYMGTGYDFQRSLSENLAHYRMFMPNGLRKVDVTSQGIGFVAEHGNWATSVMSSAHNLGAEVLRGFGIGDERLTSKGDRLFKKFAELSNGHYRRIVFENPNAGPALNVLGKYWPALNGGARGHFGFLNAQKSLGDFKDLSMAGSRAIPLSGASAHIGIPEGGVGSGHAFHEMLTTPTGRVSKPRIREMHALLKNDHGFRSVFELLKQHAATTDLQVIEEMRPGLIQAEELAFRAQDDAFLKKYIPMIEANTTKPAEFKSTLSPMRQRVYREMRKLALSISAQLQAMPAASTLEATSEAGGAVRKLLGVINVMISVRRRFG